MYLIKPLSNPLAVIPSTPCNVFLKFPTLAYPAGPKYMALTFDTINEVTNFPKIINPLKEKTLKN